MRKHVDGIEECVRAPPFFFLEVFYCTLRHYTFMFHDFCCAAVVRVNVKGENIDVEVGCSTLGELKVLLTAFTKLPLKMQLS